MALTLDSTAQFVGLNPSWNLKPTFLKFDLDNSYATGGYALTAATLGFTATPKLVVIPNNSGYSFEYDYTNAKLKVFYADNNNASDGPQIEVPNTTDLSAITGVRVIAWGN